MPSLPFLILGPHTSYCRSCDEFHHLRSHHQGLLLCLNGEEGLGALSPSQRFREPPKALLALPARSWGSPGPGVCQELPRPWEMRTELRVGRGGKKGTPPWPQASLNTWAHSLWSSGSPLVPHQIHHAGLLHAAAREVSWGTARI